MILGENQMSFIKGTIKPEIKDICMEKELNIDNKSDQGWAFQLWLARLLSKYNQNIDTDEIDDSIFSSKDGGIDIILNDRNQNHSYVIQAKYTERHVKTEDIDGFFAKQAIYTSDNFLQEREISQTSREAIQEYIYQMENGWQTTWIFATTGKIPQRYEAGDQQSANDMINFKIWNSDELRKIYNQTMSQEQSIPDEVNFDIPQKRYIEFDDPRKTLIAVVKGNKIRDLYAQYKNALLAYNIRDFLGDKQKNKDIIETAKSNDKAPDFFYFNNGISAICNTFQINDNKVCAKKFQIINGGQTVGSLFKAGNCDSVNVLLRLTEGESESTEKGFNADVIRYNNTQNIIKTSDFRANDNIQNDIRHKFLKLKHNIWDNKKVDYRPKRGGKAVGKGFKRLELEKLGKIRFAYLHSPYICVESLNLLWDVDVHYKKAFGNPDGQWSRDEFCETVLILVFFDKIDNKIKELKSKAKMKNENPSDFDYLSRLKFHILGLARIYVNHESIAITKWKKEDEFNKIFDDFWKKQIYYTSLIKGEADKIKSTRGGLGNLIRSKERWDKLKKDFINLLRSS